MAHFALMVPVWIGHLNPMTTLGRELQRRGHRISVLSFPDARERVQRAGLDFVPIGEPVFPVGEWERMTRGLSVRSGFSAAHFTIGWLERITGVMLQELPSTLRQGRYDGLVMDQTCFGAECAAAQAGVPLAVACNALPVHLQPDVPIHSETWPMSRSRGALLRNWIVQRILLTAARRFWVPIRTHHLLQGRPWNVLHHLNEIPPSLVQVAQLPACLDFERRHSPEHFHHTGPWHESSQASHHPLDPAWFDGRPLIYASLGTLQNGLDHLYQIILDACADLPVQVVLALGREKGTMPARVPVNARVLGYAPQLALIQRASLVITHAGLNTTLETLSQGLPMVALPIANEQPGIASRIHHAGVGEWLSIRSVTPFRLRAAVLKVQSNPSYRARARECASKIASTNGLQLAAGLIEEALVNRKRLIRSR